MSDEPIKVLLVEDNPHIARLLQESLEMVASASFDVQLAQRLDEAVEQIRNGAFDVLLLDLSLPDSKGLQTVIRAHEAAPHLPIVVLTATDDEMLGMETVRRGAQDYLIKGQADGRLVARSIRYAAERKRAQDERERLIGELTDALNTVKKLSGLLPICASCKKIRDETGYWQRVEQYIQEHADVSFTHGLCPECIHRLYPDYAEEEPEADSSS